MDFVGHCLSTKEYFQMAGNANREAIALDIEIVYNEEENYFTSYENEQLLVFQCFKFQPSLQLQRVKCLAKYEIPDDILRGCTVERLANHNGVHCLVVQNVGENTVTVLLFNVFRKDTEIRVEYSSKCVIESNLNGRHEFRDIQLNDRWIVVATSGSTSLILYPIQGERWAEKKIASETAVKVGAFE